MTVLKILSRVYVSDLDLSLPFYESLVGEKAGLRFPLPPGLEFARVGDLLIIAGNEDALRHVRATTASFVVDALEPYYYRLIAEGAVVIRGPQDVPTGKNMTVRHVDGSIVEYVELRRS